jgi:hypothetical protein
VSINSEKVHFAAKMSASAIRERKADDVTRRALLPIFVRTLGFALFVSAAPMAGTIAGEPRARCLSGIPSVPAVQRDHSTGGRKAARPAIEVLVCDFLVACGCAKGMSRRAGIAIRHAILRAADSFSDGPFVAERVSISRPPASHSGLPAPSCVTSE